MRRGSVHTGSLLARNLLGVYMAHSSTVQVLKVINEQKVSKEGKPYFKRSAEVVLLDDAGGVECAGSLRLSEDMVKELVPGTYRAGFSMGRIEYGDNKGDITSKLVSLVAVPVRGVTPAKASA